jgi:predicted nucleic acid-binding protein
MILVADSSALILLATIDKLDILDILFGDVVIPKSVYDEMVIPHKPQAEKLAKYAKHKIKEITNKPLFNVILGSGESDAITLYLEIGADFLLCDDKKARNYAKSININVVGSFGLLIKAKEKKLIKSIKPLVEIIEKSDIFIDKQTVKIILQSAGE